MLEIFTLGDLSIRRDGVEVTGLASRKAEALLVYLAVTRQMQPREFLAALLWEEEQERAQSNLRVVLSSLRKELNPYIDIQRDKVGILPDAHIRVDVVDLLDAALHPIVRSSYKPLHSALDLYQGTFLLGFNIRNAPMFENWVTLEREHFRTVFDNKCQTLLDCLLDGGHWQEAVACGEEWLTRSRRGYAPETAFRALMRAYAGMGDLSGLSSAYQRCIQYLSNELGIDPSEQTQELYVKLLGGRAPEIVDEAAGISISPEANAAQVVLNRWRASKADCIDMAGLSLIYASLGELRLGKEECALIMRSVLQHGLDVRSWVEPFSEPEWLVEALEGCLDCYKQPYIRLQIVDALKRISGERAVQALHVLALRDNNVSVRTEAALAALARGDGDALAHQLTVELQQSGNMAAITPLVALVDETGNLPRLEPYPRLMVWLGVVRRRWERYHFDIRSTTIRSTVTCAIASILYGSTAPLLTYLGSPEEYQITLDIMEISPFAWALSGAVGFLPIGGLQGLAAGFSIALADALFTSKTRQKWRILAGGISGLVYSIMLFLYSAADVVPESTRSQTVSLLAFIFYGLILGTGLSFLYPALGKLRVRSKQILRALLVSCGLLFVTALLVAFIYTERMSEILPSRLAFVIFFSFGIALGFSKKAKKTS